MRDAQTLTIDKHAALFEYCDIFIDTEDDAWTFIVANPKARPVVDVLFDAPINWDFGTPLQEWWTCAPPDWRAVDLNFRRLEKDGHLNRLPKIGNAETAGVHPYSLRLGVAAQSAGLRVVMYDEKTGWRTINLQDENNVIDFASARESITRHRSKSFGYTFPNGKTIDVAEDEMRRRGIEVAVDDFIATQKTTLPGLPGGPPLLPSSPVVSFENGHLANGQDVLERIVRNGKSEAVTLQFGKPGPTFPSHIHLFELSSNICGSISSDDRKQMLADLQTAGLLHLPFDQIAVRFWLPDLGIDVVKAHMTFSVSGALYIPAPNSDVVASEKMFDGFVIEFLDGRTIIENVSNLTGKDHEIDQVKKAKLGLMSLCLDALTTLVLALATRNVIKRTATNNRIGAGQRPKARFLGPQGAIYLSSTVVEAPDATDMDDDPDHPAQEGTAKRPHMRRGHLHTVLHGVGRRERRVKWFPAVFVNADPAFVADARKYVVMP